MPADQLFYNRSPQFKVAFNNLCDTIMEEYEGRHIDADRTSPTNEPRDDTAETAEEITADQIESILRGES